MKLARRSLIWSCFAGTAIFVGILAAGWFFFIQRVVPLQICMKAPIAGGVQVYYRDNQSTCFSEERCIHVRPTKTPAVADVVVPVRELCELRIDFGSAPGDFIILGGMVGGVPFPPWKAWSFSPDVKLKCDLSEPGELKLFSDGSDPFMHISFSRPIPSVWTLNRNNLVLMLSLALAVALAMGRVILQGNNLARGESGGWSSTVFIGLSVNELFFLFICALYYTLWIFQPFDLSPDEAMRFWVTRFLFEHGRLPMNAETIGQPWGFSYAHFPTMFSNVAGAFFMKITSLFTSDTTVLLRAARMLGVFCITGTVYWTIRISRLLFGKPFNWLPVCIVTFLPQFAYIGSYVNNDSAVLLGGSMILFAWMSAIDKHWNYKNATILSVGIAICAISYYNSYSWILLSMFMFPLTYIVRNGKTGLVKMGLFISCVVFCLAGYLFLRHLYLYGDLLGFATAKSFAMKYARSDLVPSIKKSLFECGHSLSYMLFELNWIKASALSFVGYFGYLQCMIPSWCYASYALILGTGGLGVLWKGIDLIRDWRHIGICKWALLVSLVGCIMITIGLSMYASFTRDCQSQGRYCFPALLPIALLAAKGIERILNGMVSRKLHGVLVFALCLLLGLVTEASYLSLRDFINWRQM